MPIYNYSTGQQIFNLDSNPDMRTDSEKQNSPLALYNQGSEDITYAEKLADEVINLTGAPIIILKRHRSANRDDVWDEDADPNYSSGVTLKGKFVPTPAETALTKWGVDVTAGIVIHFSRIAVYKAFGGDMIAEGDILVVPLGTLNITQHANNNHSKITKFRVLKATDAVYYRYRYMYWEVTIQNITGDKSLDPAYREGN